MTDTLHSPRGHLFGNNSLHAVCTWNHHQKKKKKKNYPDSFGHCGVTHKAPQQEAVKEEGLSPKKCQSINLF